MKKILLTSTGFDNVNIKNKFLELLDMEPSQAKVLFIITAAIDAEAIRILPSCLDDLTSCGIKEENIKVYDMHKKIDLTEYQAIYVCGGNTDYLESRIEELNMQEVLKSYIANGGIYVGVSAGSVAVAKNYPNGLCLLDNILDVHCDNGTNNGPVNNTKNIYLTDNQAIYINDSETLIFE